MGAEASRQLEQATGRMEGTPAALRAGWTRPPGATPRKHRRDASSFHLPAVLQGVRRFMTLPDLLCLASCSKSLNTDIRKIGRKRLHRDSQRFLLGSRWSQHQPPLPGEHQADKFARLGMERDTEDWDCVFRLGLLWARANSPLRVLEQAVSIVDAVYSKFAFGELNYDRILTPRTLPITALYIASKLEEVHPLYASMAEQITKSTVRVDDLLACEATILFHLDWRLPHSSLYLHLSSFEPLIADVLHSHQPQREHEKSMSMTKLSTKLMLRVFLSQYRDCPPAHHAHVAMAIACTVLLLLVPMDCTFEQALATGSAVGKCGDSDDFDPVRQGESEEIQEIRNMLPVPLRSELVAGFGTAAAAAKAIETLLRAYKTVYYSPSFRSMLGNRAAHFNRRPQLFLRSVSIPAFPPSPFSDEVAAGLAFVLLATFELEQVAHRP